MDTRTAAQPQMGKQAFMESGWLRKGFVCVYDGLLYLNIVEQSATLLWSL